MTKVTFIQTNGTPKTVEAPENFSLMQIAKDNGIDGIEGACGGCMSCATCHLVVHPDWAARVAAQDNEKTPEEDDVLDTAFHVEQNSRLGCQIKINPALDGLVVALPGVKRPW